MQPRQVGGEGREPSTGRKLIMTAVRDIWKPHLSFPHHFNNAPVDIVKHLYPVISVFHTYGKKAVSSAVNRRERYEIGDSDQG